MNVDEEHGNLPPPPDDPDEPDESTEGRRLWIGNVDTRLTEFSLVKVLQKYGSLDKFDFIYHKTGPNAGKPRGYCFVTYKSKQEASDAMKALDGKLALSKRLVVKSANMNRKEMTEKRLGIPLSKEKPLQLAGSRSAQIHAIEAKLRVMERAADSSGPVLSVPSKSKDTTGHSGSRPGQSVNKPGSLCHPGPGEKPTHSGYGRLKTSGQDHRKHLPYVRSKPR